MLASDAKSFHGDKRQQHGDGKRCRNDQAAADVQQEQQNHDRRDDNFFSQSGGERANRFVNQPSSVVDRLDRDAVQ